MSADMAFRMATFNAGLAVGVLPYATERVACVVAALEALDADLLFVQEFWLESHWERLRGAVRARLPYAFRPEPTEPAPRSACRAADVLPLRACAKEHCAGLTDEALARCVVQHCAAAALSLPGPCLNCIASHPVGSLDEILDRCVAREAAAVPDASSHRGLIAYGGSFGTGLLSRVPLERPESLVFESSVNARGAVHVVSRLPVLGAVHVFATHLSPGGAEQEPQVTKLIDWISKSAGNAPSVLFGDLNTTPGSALFRRFEQAGFHEPKFADRKPTFAPDGLGTGRVSRSGYRLDHILLRGIDAEVRTQRVLDEPVTIEVGEKRVVTTLSDHFGILATIGD